MSRILAYCCKSFAMVDFSSCPLPGLCDDLIHVCRMLGTAASA